MKIPSRRQITTWSKLQKKRYRQKESLFLAEGERCVSQILRNRFIAVEALLRTSSSGWIPENDCGDLYEIEESDFGRITDTENPQGVAAVCRIPEELPPQVLAERRGLAIAVDAIQDPGNLGTIIRTSSWFGAVALICGSGSVDPFNPKVVRSTAGATGSIPVLSGDLGELLQRLESAGWRILLLDAGGDALSVRDAGKSEKTVLVVGNEANGVDPRLFSDSRRKVKIQAQAAAVESLNAAVALSIALYELNR